MTDEIRSLARKRRAVILAHYYCPDEVQEAADYVGDSLGLARTAAAASAEVIVFAGVHFMAETASILCPDKKVVLTHPGAGCPMADMITPEDLKELKTQYPDHLVMCYVNSTVDIKALSDVCCTSANAEQIASRLPEDRSIIFVPDQYLGSWVMERTGREMILWNGLCPTHLRITPDLIRAAHNAHPDAEILVHPEATHECRELADAVLSTGGMCDYAEASSCKEFIIATENGLLHTLRTRNPDKSFFPVSETIICPNMKRGSLVSLRNALRGTGGEHIVVEEETAKQAQRSIDEMLRLGN